MILLKGNWFLRMSFRYIFVLTFISSLLEAGSFRLVTYNILSDDFLWDEMYDFVDKDILFWPNRRVKIVERIKKLNPDVICLQELNSSSFEYFKESFPQFEGSFAKKLSGSEDGVGTFCRKNFFKAIQHEKKIDVSRTAFATQPALVTTLGLDSDRSVTLVNTKIKWSKTVRIGDSIWNQIQFILKTIPSKSTVIVGDFNIQPHNPIMNQFHLSGLQDAFSDKKTYTCFANDMYQRVDYILLSKDLQSVPIECLSLDSAKPMPNETEPSDHLPIGCMVTYE